MKTSQHINRFFPSLLLIFAVSFLSCKQITQAISNLLTFPITKTAPDIPILQYTPTGIMFASPGVPIGIDSADLAKQKTSLSLVKTVKLTGMTLATDDPYYLPTNIDTLTLSVGLDSLHTILLATYIGATDTKTLTNTDFSAQVKNSNNKLFAKFRLKNDPSHTVNLQTSYTLTFSADPL